MPLLQIRNTETNNGSNAVGTVESDAVDARVDVLLRRLRPRDQVLDPDVVKELESMGDAALPGLNAAVEHCIPRRLMWFRRACGLWLTAELVIALMAWIPGLGLQTPLRPLLVLLAASGASSALCLRFWPSVSAHVLRLLVQQDDVRTVGALADAYAWISSIPFGSESSRSLVGTMRDCLVRLLPRLSATDSGWICSRQRQVLRKLLHRAAISPGFGGRIDPDFAFALIKALVQIGDIDSLPALRHLAAKGGDDEVRRIAVLGVGELEKSTSAAYRLAESSGAWRKPLRNMFVVTVTAGMLLSLDLSRCALNSDLKQAVTSSTADAVEQLLRRGADPNAITPQYVLRWQWLNEVYARNRSSDRRHLWQDLNYAISSPWFEDTTPLCTVLTPEMVRVLVSYGADINMISGRRGLSTPLVNAIARYPFYYDVRSLMSYDPPAAQALLQKRSRVARALLAAGADPNLCNDAGFTPLMLAIRQRDAGIVSILIDAGADLNRKGRWYDSPLLFLTTELCSEPGDEAAFLPVVETLVSHGADVNAKTDVGQTVLELFKLHRYYKIARLLEKAGAK